MRARIFALLLLSQRAPAIAQQPRTSGGTETAVALAQTVQHQLISSINGREYRLFIALPPGYYAPHADTSRYPVLYLLDGEVELPVFTTMLRLSHRGPPGNVILVGVGYPPGSDPFAPPPGGNARPFRARDYTPPPYPARDPAHADWASHQPWAGGAEAFLRVLRDEVIPFVDRTYRTNGDRGLHGHSHGALFATYALFEAPALFNRLAITSPSYWWDGGSIFQREQAFAAATPTLANRVYLSVGGLEGADMIADVMRMAQALCRHADEHRYQGLQLMVEIVPDEEHQSTVSLSRALRALYPPSPDIAAPRNPCSGR